MEIWKVVLRLWALLSLLSLAIAGACVWIDANGRAQAILDSYGINHVTLFLWSAPAPFVLAILMPILGVFLSFIGWSVGAPHRAPAPRRRKQSRTAAIRPARPAAAARRDGA